MRDPRLVSLEAEYKEKYHSYGSIPVWKIKMMRDMAASDIWPDGEFGDEECLLWSTFRSELKLVKERITAIATKYNVDNKDGAE